jgi:predicted methyltransferase
MLPGRALHGITKQSCSKICKVKQGAKVITIESVQNVLTMESAV